MNLHYGAAAAAASASFLTRSPLMRVFEWLVVPLNPKLQIDLLDS